MKIWFKKRYVRECFLFPKVQILKKKTKKTQREKDFIFYKTEVKFWNTYTERFNKLNSKEANNTTATAPTHLRCLEMLQDFLSINLHKDIIRQIVPPFPHFHPHKAFPSIRIPVPHPSARSFPFIPTNVLAGFYCDRNCRYPSPSPSFHLVTV